MMMLQRNLALILMKILMKLLKKVHSKLSHSPSFIA